MAVIIIHRDALTFQILEALDAFTANKIIFPPGIVALRDMHVGIAVESLAHVQIVMIARDDIEVTRLQPVRRAFALPLERSHLHFQSVLLEKPALFHHFPQRHVTRRPIMNFNFLSHHSPTFPGFSLNDLNGLNPLNALNSYFPLSTCHTFSRFSCRPVTIQFQSVSSKYLTPFFGKLPGLRFASSISVRRLTEPKPRA